MPPVFSLEIRYRQWRSVFSVFAAAFKVEGSKPKCLGSRISEEKNVRGITQSLFCYVDVDSWSDEERAF